MKIGELFEFINMCPFLIDEGELNNIMQDDIVDIQVSEASSSSDSRV